MHIGFVVPELTHLDRLKSEALALPFFEDDRPLRGALGLVDWRLAGLLSQFLAKGRATGARGERILVPPRPKLPFERLVLFGCGRRADFDTGVFSEIVADMLTTLERVSVRSAVLSLPGRSHGVIDAGSAVELFLRQALVRRDYDELILIEDSEAQREVDASVKLELRRLHAAG